MLIGLGGGAASSMDTGANAEDLDFDSVQRGNPEMQRRAQEVIDRCWQLGEGNPILSIHDVGAGGLSNALPELVHGSGRGGRFNLRAVPSTKNPACRRCRSGATRRRSATCWRSRRRVWSCSRPCASASAARYAVVGEATSETQLMVEDSYFNNKPVDMDMHVLLGKPPKMTRNVAHARARAAAFRSGAAGPERGGLARAAPAGGGATRPS